MLQQVVAPESSTGHQSCQCSSEKKPLQIFLRKSFCRFLQQPAVKPLKYQSTKTRVGKRGRGVMPMLCANSWNQACNLNDVRRLFVIQSLMKNMPEVTFVTVSYTCLMVFTGRYDTSNLPLREISTSSYQFNNTDRGLGPASSKQDCSSHNTTGFQVFPLKFQLFAGMLLNSQHTGINYHDVKTPRNFPAQVFLLQVKDVAYT